MGEIFVRNIRKRLFFKKTFKPSFETGPYSPIAGVENFLCRNTFRRTHKDFLGDGARVFQILRRPSFGIRSRQNLARHSLASDDRQYGVAHSVVSANISLADFRHYPVAVLVRKSAERIRAVGKMPAYYDYIPASGFVKTLCPSARHLFLCGFKRKSRRLGEFFRRICKDHVVAHSESVNSRL